MPYCEDTITVESLSLNDNIYYHEHANFQASRASHASRREFVPSGRTGREWRIGREWRTGREVAEWAASSVQLRGTLGSASEKRLACRYSAGGGRSTAANTAYDIRQSSGESAAQTIVLF